jgi:hypothetical protein
MGSSARYFMKPLLKVPLTPQFKIPAPFRAWCHRCDRGFMSLEELTDHDRDALNEHRRLDANEKRRADDARQDVPR